MKISFADKAKNLTFFEYCISEVIEKVTVIGMDTSLISARTTFNNS